MSQVIPINGQPDVYMTGFSIRDTFGTKHVNIKFGKGATLWITAPNGSGKTSIFRSLRRPCDGGKDPSIIRKGTAESVVEIDISDGHHITSRTWVQKPRRGAPETEIKYGYELSIVGPNGNVIPAPKEFLDELMTATAIDPSKILNIDTTKAEGRKELAKLLLSLMRLRFEPDEIRQAVGYRSTVNIPRDQYDVFALDVPSEPLDLDKFEKLPNQVSETRRVVGQRKKDSDGAVNRLRLSIPPDDSVDHKARLTELEQDRIKIEQAISKARLQIESDKNDAIQQAMSDFTKDTSEAEIAYQQAVSAATKIRDAAKLKAQQTLDKVRTACLKAERESQTELELQSGPEVSRVTAAIAETKEKIEAQTRAQYAKEQLRCEEETCRAANWQYDQLTEVLGRLDTLRLRKLEMLPVPGLMVRGDQAYIDGVEWEIVNTARQVEIVVQLCAQLAGRCRVIMIDNAEHLTVEKRRLLQEGLRAAGFQVFFARVAHLCECGHEHAALNETVVEKCPDCKCSDYRKLDEVKIEVKEREAVTA